MITENEKFEHRKMLPFAEAATYLGVSKSTLYKLTHTKAITHYKPGGKLIYFNVADLDEWMQRGCVQSDADVEAQAEAFLRNNPMFN